MLLADYKPTHTERRHFAGSGETGGPEFRCSHAGCQEYFFEQTSRSEDPMQRCECGKWFCPSHVTAIKDLHFCEDCARCQRMHNGTQCGDKAVTMCDGCGDLLCAGDARGEVGNGIHCKGGCTPEPIAAQMYDPNDAQDFGRFGDCA